MEKLTPSTVELHYLSNQQIRDASLGFFEAVCKRMDNHPEIRDNPAVKSRFFNVYYPEMLKDMLFYLDASYEELLKDTPGMERRLKEKNLSKMFEEIATKIYS